ncbi:histidine phosphatase family protein [Candidatus Poriferisodalis sp.]|uniref:histidine phosphatase family protein n=1 Tax=Candidatus Poriferisodalis sp. TaxID=3101277 RepID=UPI003B521740
MPDDPRAPRAPMLILVRHGRTSANAAGLLQGRVDNELDDVGIQQASQIAAALALGDHRPDRIVSSPLKRAHQTADATRHLLGIEMTIDERWAELDYGEWDGVPISEVRPDMWEQWQSDPGFALPGGESLVELNQRVEATCNDLAEEAASRNIAVFTHVSPIKSAVRWVLGTEDEISWRIHVSQAQIAHIQIRAGVPRLSTFNDTSHLSS